MLTFMIRNIFILCFSAIIFLSCNNEIDLNETFREIPVTYGILNSKDTAQYIRIERVFNSSGESALVLAKNTDSLYYNNITVKLKDETSGKEFELTRIDGNTDKHSREDGIFATAPNYLYKIKTDKIGIKPGNKYSLNILNSDKDTLTKSTIEIVKDMSIYIPASNEKPVKLLYFSNFNINWEGGSNAGYYDVLITFNIKEKNTSGSNIWTDRSFTWKAGEFLTDQKLRLGGEDFYKFIGTAIEPDENILRRFSGFDITVRGVGKELKEFIDILHFDSGITSSQQLPTYSNMSYGYGVFSSQNSVKSSGFLLDEIARDSLRIGVYTKRLNFE
jgi:hypothetical protein